MTRVNLPPDLDFAADPAASPERMNRAMANLHLRTAALETYRPNFDALFAQLQGIGLQRISDALAPVYAELMRLSDLGAVFTAISSSAVAVATGPATFVIADVSRSTFAPAAYMAALAADQSAALAGTTTSYDRASGALVLQVGYVFGSGTVSSWIVTPTVPPLLSMPVVDGGSFP